MWPLALKLLLSLALWLLFVIFRPDSPDVEFAAEQVFTLLMVDSSVFQRREPLSEVLRQLGPHTHTLCHPSRGRTFIHKRRSDF